jgi:hypothetical protein
LVSEWACLPGGQWGRGTLWRDLSRQSLNDGTLTNGPTWVGARGRPGGYGAISFDGSNDSVNVGSSTSVNVVGECTCVCWLKSVANNATVRLIWNGTFGSTKNYSFDLGRTTARVSALWAGTVVGTSNTNLSNGTWYHVAMVRSGSTGSWTVTFYINGKSDGGGTTATNPTGTSFTSIIGNTDVTDGSYSGVLDGMQVYSKALSANEVLALYQESLAGNPSRWRWLGKRSYFFPVAAATGTGPLIGPGRLIGGGPLIRSGRLVRA